MHEIRPRIRAALLVRRQDRILLIRHQKNNEKYWLVPGGGVDYGESVLNCLSREMNEELNVTVTDFGNLIFCHDSISPAGTKHIFNLYIEGSVNGSPRVGDEPNLIEADWFDSAQISDLDMRPPIQKQLIKWLSGQSFNNPYCGALWG